MASACVQNMNMHMMSQNCILISSQNCLSHTNSGNHHQVITQSLNKGPIIQAPSSNSLTSTNKKILQTSILGMNGVNVQSTTPQDGPRYKKKFSYTNIPYGGEQPPSVARRNARERNRVKQVNNGFANLRQHIPQTIIAALTNGGRGASKKLSKVDTLRLAVEYIRRLQDLLEETGGELGNKTKSSQDSISSTSSSSSYYPGSPEHFSTQSSPSPTPSYNSDVSIGNNNYIQTSGQFKFTDSYDPYNSMKSEDEELLDYISSWQDQ